MPFSDSVTQGGQTFLHKMRMVRQIARLAILIALTVGVIVFAAAVKIKIPPQVFQTAQNYALARWQVWTEGEGTVLKIKNGQGTYTVSAKNFLNMAQTNKHICYFKDSLLFSGILGGISFFLTLISVFGIWARKGKKDKKKTHLSGQKICSGRSLKLKLLLKGQASDIKIGEFPLLKNSETKHFLISGTTGSGKTNCFFHILSHVRKLNHKAIIIDTSGNYVSRFFRKDYDILLNPLDNRSVGWHPWIECPQKYHYAEMARNFIPSDVAHDPFWTNSARIVFAAAMEKMAETGIYNINSLINILAKASIEALHALLQDTEAAPLIDPSADKTSASIRSTVTSYISPLRFLKNTTNPFSIKKWVQDDKCSNWLFLTMIPEQREALRPLLSAWTSIAVKSLLGCSPNEKRRLWFFIDELPTLHKINDLTTCLAESRKYGGCITLGLQNLPQLEEIYGPHQSKSIIDLCSTKILLRMSSYDLAEHLSKTLGEREISEIQEGISYGANEIRDGVSLSKINREKPAVSPTDLMSLEDLEGYIKLPGNYPVAKIKMAYKKIPVKNKAFIAE